MAFKKGQSGNPGGRPKELKGIQDMARVHSAHMLNVLVKVATDKKASYSARVAAADAVLNRAYGKPAQAITGADGGPIKTEDVSELDLVRRIAFALEKTARDPKGTS